MICIHLVNYCLLRRRIKGAARAFYSHNVRLVVQRLSGADPGMKKRGGGGTLLLVVEGSARSAQCRGVWGHAPQENFET